MMTRLGWKENVAAGVVGMLLPLTLAAQEKSTVPPGTAVNITVQPAPSTAPPISFVLGPRHGHVTPERHGCTHTGGGNIDVAQPSPDVLIVTMSGAAVAYGALRDAMASQAFDLEQCFEASFDNPKVKKGKLTMEGRVVGLLRSHCNKDSAAYDDACAAVGVGPTCILKLCVPPHSVGGKQALGVNDHAGPFSVPITAGKYLLRQTFHVSAMAHPTILPTKGPSAEFAPDPAIDPLWLSYKEPFHGAVKKDFGFQVILRLAEDTEAADQPANGEKPAGPAREKLPEPTPVPNL
ncbi:MAG TPA: hypothetical protein VMG10_06040 [Gemmataceae bacterium]|nr:hypothetical protein [Gemmataceae bacterium]